MNVLADFGCRLRELRARSGMSQELLAQRSGLSRQFLSGIERGERNVSLLNMDKIATALNVTIEYLFSSERFSTDPAYLQKDFSVPFIDRFKYGLDTEKKILSFQVNGLLTGDNVDYMNSTLMGICSHFNKGELTLLVDHRDMKTADGEAVVYSPDVAKRAVIFQQNLLKYNKHAIVLCNSEFMVHQLNTVTAASGIPSVHLYGKDKDIVGEAYELLEINGHDLIKTAM